MEQFREPRNRRQYSQLILITELNNMMQRRQSFQQMMLKQLYIHISTSESSHRPYNLQ
jgi:hypothetical protein